MSRRRTFVEDMQSHAIPLLRSVLGLETAGLDWDQETRGRWRTSPLRCMFCDLSNQFGELIPFALTPRLVQGRDVGLPLLGIASLVRTCQHKYWVVSMI